MCDAKQSKLLEQSLQHRLECQLVYENKIEFYYFIIIIIAYMQGAASFQRQFNCSN